ncbi:unnamed protein product [Bursaphelenchus okinawaensis]|uniref:Peptidase A1 domain-containing protein n=1 Tax=Bursaphelenchus okinawaensis TaxID=465554 RepID=A0A811KYQ2_9BILA|nr:unnamed protein product [Bursaphelenchus okinawaensis]CAG9114406.1 unnamed protein product [Bursaphelenchus okinawaensis]
MKFRASLFMFLVGYVNCIYFDSITHLFKARLGSKSSLTTDFHFERTRNDIFVFGKECAKTNCTTDSHQLYDFEADGKTLSGNYVEFKDANVYTRDCEDVSFTVADKTSTHTVKVAVAPVDEKSIWSYKYDGYVGIMSGKDSAFDKIVNSYDNKHMLIVPWRVWNPTMEGDLLLGEESKKCGNFSFTDSDSNYWSTTTTIGEGDDKKTIKIAPAFVSITLAKKSIMEKYFTKENDIDEATYKTMKSYKMTYAGFEFTIEPKHVFLKLDGRYYTMINPLDDDDEIDFAFGYDIFKQNCFKMVKDGDKYKIGLAERLPNTSAALADGKALSGKSEWFAGAHVIVRQCDKVSLTIENQTTTHNIKIAYAPMDSNSPRSFLYDAFIGIKAGKDSAFDKILDAYSKKHMLIVPWRVQAGNKQNKAVIFSSARNQNIAETLRLQILKRIIGLQLLKLAKVTSRKR